MFFKRRARNVSLDISKDICTGCGKCMAKCRHDALRLKWREDKAWVWLAYPDRCVGCGHCKKACSHGAIVITEQKGVVNDAFI